MNELAKENQTYLRLLPTLLAEEGKFALILGDNVVGTFDTYADAIKVGYEKAGLTPFLVKRITQVEDSVSFSRPLILCRA